MLRGLEYSRQDPAANRSAYIAGIPGRVRAGIQALSTLLSRGMRISQKPKKRSDLFRQNFENESRSIGSWRLLFSLQAGAHSERLGCDSAANLIKRRSEHFGAVAFCHRYYSFLLSIRSVQRTRKTSMGHNTFPKNPHLRCYHLLAFLTNHGPWTVFSEFVVVRDSYWLICWSEGRSDSR